MAIRTIDDIKLQNIAVAIQGKDGGGQMTVDQMPTRIEQNLQSKAVLDSVIDGSITSIESDALIINYYKFYHCASLTTAKFDEATSIRSNAFSFCSNLIYISINSLNSLSANSFSNCTSLTRLFIPNVMQFDLSVFASCTALNAVILNSRATLRNVNAFYQCPAIIYVQPEDLSWYETATNWSTLYAQDRIKSIEDLTGDDLVWYQEQLARYQAQTA